jgi:hypothetical protein
MNDKLLNLAIKTGLVNYIDNETPKSYFTSFYIELEDIEEFAQLLLKQCVQLALTNDDVFTARAIENHFDVSL